MFPLLNKHLYLGQDVDGYDVVSFNSNYTGGLMRTQYYNDPVISQGLNYADTVSFLSSFNSGGGTPFSDWRIPSKDEMQEMINVSDSAPGLVTSNRTAWTSTEGEVGGIPTPSTNWALEYSSTGSPSYYFSAYDKAGSYFGVFFIRNFTL